MFIHSEPQNKPKLLNPASDINYRGHDFLFSLNLQCTKRKRNSQLLSIGTDIDFEIEQYMSFQYQSNYNSGK